MKGLLNPWQSACRVLGAVLMATLVGCATPPKPSWLIPDDAAIKVINGYPLTYSTRGSGPIVVFVPGVLTDYRVWGQPLKSWEANYQVIAISPRHFYPEKWEGRRLHYSPAREGRCRVH
jgi:esterase